MANISGDYPDTERVPTGLWSLDHALSGIKNGKLDLGVPMTLIEIFGFQGIGKSTFASSLMSIISNHWGKKSVYAPFEMIDRELLANILDYYGCDNEVTLLGTWDTVKKFFPSYKRKKDEKLTDELMLDCFIEAARREDYCVGVIDSLSTIYTIGEAGSSVADRNMGRARIVSNFARALPQALRWREENTFASIILSHKTSPMGGGAPTNTGAPTTGGEVKKNVAKIRLSLRRLNEPAFEMDSQKNLYEKNAFILEGRAEKNNFGRDDKKFYVAMLGGKGAHIGLTAMYECKRLGIASFGKSGNLGGKKFDTVAKMVAYAHAGEDEPFQMFIDALQDPSKFSKVKSEDELEQEGQFIDDENEE